MRYAIGAIRKGDFLTHPHTNTYAHTKKYPTMKEAIGAIRKGD